MLNRKQAREFSALFPGGGTFRRVARQGLGRGMRVDRARQRRWAPPTGTLTERELDRLERLDKEDWTLEHNGDGSD